MTSGWTPAAPPPVAPDGAAAQGENWWPVALAIAAAAVLHMTLPAKYRVDPAWVVPAVLLALLAALLIGDPGRIDRQKTWLRIVTGAVIAFITVANLFAAVHLVHDILTNNKLYASNATGLLATGAVIWATNVIAFGLWYWDLDRGGAAARAHHPQANPAFIFPEMLHTRYVPAPWGRAIPSSVAVALAAGVPASEAGRAAAAAGAAAVTCRGAQTAMPRPADVLAAAGVTWPVA